MLCILFAVVGHCLEIKANLFLLFINTGMNYNNILCGFQGAPFGKFPHPVRWFFSHIDLHDVQAKKTNTLLGVRMIRGNPLVYVARQGGPYQIPT